MKLIARQAVYSKNPQATNEAETLNAWTSGKDFQAMSGLHNGRYFSIRDVEALKQEGYTIISVRLITGPKLAEIKL